MFNPLTGAIERLPAGTVYEKAKAKDFSGIGAATFWHPEEITYKSLEPDEIKRLSAQAARGDIAR